MKLLLRWALAAAAVWAAVRVVPGISIEEGLQPLFLVALILGAVNVIVRPVLRMLSCGLVFLTLGLFLVVINAAMLLLTGSIAQAFGIDFSVDGFVPALLGSLVISVVSFLASFLLSDSDDD